MAQTTDDIMVSVCMITYNHESFIREAIEGVLMQKTPFAFELVIGEDFSTDKTRTICEEYAIRFPDKIKLLPAKMNLGMMPNFIRTIEACRGKYIALCEGDDYWTDPLKLQKQVEFLEQNEKCSLCFTNAYDVFNNNAKKDRLSESFNCLIKDEYLTPDIVRTNFIATATIVFKRDLILDLIDTKEFLKAPAGDWIISYYLSFKGQLGLINEITAIRRIHAQGCWSSLAKEKNLQNTILIYKTFIKLPVRSDAKLIRKLIRDTRYLRVLTLLDEKRKLAAYKDILKIVFNYKTPPKRIIYILIRLIKQK